MPNSNIVLIGFQDQGNLGLGYLGAVLQQAGFRPTILEFRDEPESLAAAILNLNPLILGFSLIFQYYLPQFARLAAYFRDCGISAYFTTGGHFPTLEPAYVLRTIPQMDSVVRGEGEETLVELARCLRTEVDWRMLHGLAFRNGDDIVVNPSRPLIADLDSLPHPLRSFKLPTVFGWSIAPILASRGCARSCTFCSIHQFYRTSPGKAVRIRQPRRVAEEMLWLYSHEQVRIFLFQDDDFPVWGKFGRRWVDSFLAALREYGLHENVLWKISCRADQVESQLFQRMRECGLYEVYLGIESGTEQGLAALGKQTTVADNREAVRILRELDLILRCGFMMFDPSTTLASLRENLAFERWLVDDDMVAAAISRTMPYAGTSLKQQLVQEGRLLGSVETPDYSYQDVRVSELFNSLEPLVRIWVYGQESIVNQVNWAWEEFGVLLRLFPPMPGSDDYRERLKGVTRAANDYLLNTFEQVMDTFEGSASVSLQSETIAAASESLTATLLSCRNEFVMNNSQTILSACPLVA